MKAERLAFKVFKNFLAFKTGKPSPLFASYNVTSRCNMRCAYCNWWKMETVELSTSKALAVIENVCSLGVAFFDFSGGEPLLRRDLVKLAKRASSHNCLVSMNTNGTLLRREDVSKIADVFDVVVVSIDGPKECHDRIRGVAGTFQKAMEAVKMLKTHGVRVGVNAVISPWNIEVLPTFIEELRPTVDFVQVQPMHPYPTPPENKPPTEKVLTLQERLLMLKREAYGFLAVPTEFIQGFRAFFDGKAPKICDAGRLYVAIDPSGNLLACAAKGEMVLGNLLVDSAWDILLGNVENGKDGWVKVASCEGCWLECTVGVSMTVRNPLKEAVHIARLL